MSLGDHLRELRRRVVISAVAVLVASGVGWWQYSTIFDNLTRPLTQLAAQRGPGKVEVSFQYVTDSFSLLISVGLFVGVLLSSPVWLYQIWAFINPGLHSRERRTALWFLGAAVPLFLAGCLLGYVTLPRALDALLSFTPASGANIMPASDYLNFVLRFILAFGIAFLLPVFQVGLNLIHVLSARNMIRFWRPIVFIIFVFAAVMTPSPDPWSMLFLALPMVALYFAAVGLSALFDRRRLKRTPEWAAVPDDRASTLE